MNKEALPTAALGAGGGGGGSQKLEAGESAAGRAEGPGARGPAHVQSWRAGGTPPGGGGGESRAALPNATSPGVLWHRTRRESERELPSRRGLFLTCPPFYICLGGARPPARSCSRGRGLLTSLAGSGLRASPGPAPALARASAATPQPGKGRLGAACLSAKYPNRVGWGRGAGARPLASLAPSHPAWSGGARRLQLPASPK